MFGQVKTDRSAVRLYPVPESLACDVGSGFAPRVVVQRVDVEVLRSHAVYRAGTLKLINGEITLALRKDVNL